jgi:hypothetical protein
VRDDGRIDLGAKSIDLTFTPQPKPPTLTVAVSVHVRGPLRKPPFNKDTKATLGKLLGIAGIVVYPPAAVLAPGDLGGSENPSIGLMRGKATGSRDQPGGTKNRKQAMPPCKASSVVSKSCLANRLRKFGAAAGRGCVAVELKAFSSQDSAIKTQEKP